MSVSPCDFINVLKKKKIALCDYFIMCVFEFLKNLLPCGIISYCSFIRYSRVYLYCIVASQRFASQSAVSAQINDSKRLLLAGASISKKVAFMIGHFMVKSESLKIPTFYRWPFFFFEGQHF